MNIPTMSSPSSEMFQETDLWLSKVTSVLARQKLLQALVQHEQIAKAVIYSGELAPAYEEARILHFRDTVSLFKD